MYLFGKIPSGPIRGQNRPHRTDLATTPCPAFSRSAVASIRLLCVARGVAARVHAGSAQVNDLRDPRLSASAHVTQSMIASRADVLDCTAGQRLQTAPPTKPRKASKGARRPTPVRRRRPDPRRLRPERSLERLGRLDRGGGVSAGQLAGLFPLRSGLRSRGSIDAIARSSQGDGQMGLQPRLPSRGTPPALVP
jgi:hypothetical protein